jgi:Protein of unknown function (DUF2958)
MNRYKIFSKLTAAQYDQLIKNGSAENRDKDHSPVAKLFLPGTGFTWLLTEIDSIDTNIAFGLCDLGMGFPELGYVDLDELGQTFTPYKMSVERDLHFKGRYPISVYAEAARSVERITEDDDLLQIAAKKLLKCNPH